MARKKAKRYDDGGEIVVSGSRAEDARALDRMMREPSFVGGGGDFGGGSLGGRFGGDSDGGGSSSPKMSVGKVRTPVGKVFGLRDIPVGERGSFDFGASPMGGGKVGGTFKTSFKKGGTAKKMAKGGSTASKRGDGIATKGKTKGRFV